MNRRVLILGIIIALLTAPALGRAQQASEVRRIGYLGLNSQPAVQHFLEVLRQSLRQHGWDEGRNLAIEYRFAHGKSDRLRELADELVRAKVEVILAPSEEVIFAARLATETIPILMVAAADPVASGLVASLARPGGNVTGLSISAPDLAAKRLQLLSEGVPRLSRLAVLWNSENSAKALELEQVQAAARSLRMTVWPVPLRGAGPAFQSAFQIMREERVQTLIVLGDAWTWGHRANIASLAAANRLPTMWEGNIFMDAGGLLSYGPDISDQFRRIAPYVDKILRGTRPAELPVQQPTKFELIINLKTARALGLTMPPSLLSRADKVME